MIGKAFLLDGVDDWIDVSGPGPEIGASDFTVDLWVNFRSTEGEQVLVEKWVETYDASAVGWTFTKLGDNSVGLYGHGFGAMSRPLYLSTNKWLHFAARREDSTLTLLVNGVVVDQQAVDPSATDMVTPASLKFGHRGGADDTPGTDDRRGFYLSGLIDEAHLFIGRALTFDEIESIYEARAAGLCPLGSRV